MFTTLPMVSSGVCHQKENKNNNIFQLFHVLTQSSTSQSRYRHHIFSLIVVILMRSRATVQTFIFSIIKQYYWETCCWKQMDNSEAILDQLKIHLFGYISFLYWSRNLVIWKIEITTHPLVFLSDQFLKCSLIANLGCWKHSRKTTQLVICVGRNKYWHFKLNLKY